MFAGFDYGTSNCSIGLVRDGNVTLVPLEDGDPLIPSTLYAPRPQLQLERARRRHSGSRRNDPVVRRTAIRSRGARGLSRSAVGRLLRQESEEFSRCEGPERRDQARFVGVVTAMMANVKRHADAAAGESDRRRRHRAADQLSRRRWRGRKPQRARDAGRVARSEAGFKRVEFLYEPMAAAMEYEARLDHEECVLVLDIGGGTTDCSFVRVGPTRRASHRTRCRHSRSRRRTHRRQRLRSAARAARRNGDCWAMETSWYRVCRSRTPTSSMRCRRTTSTRSNASTRGVRWSASIGSCVEARFPDRIGRLRSVQTERLTYRIVRSAELAKVALSDAERTDIDLDLPGAGSRAARRTVRVFAQACERLLVHLEGLVTESVAAAGREPDVIYLTGGMARATIVRNYLERKFPTARFVDSDHFASVTRGS